MLEPWQSKLVTKAVEARDLLRERARPNVQDHPELPDAQIKENLRSSLIQRDLPEGHPAVPLGLTNMSCPFAASSTARKTEQQSVRTEASLPQRPDSLPTPPETSRYFEGGGAKEAVAAEHSSPPPSITGSVSKCPIRMLDERPLEEIAEYFETHKHEIPRSHEVCVRRYQSNVQSIRQLDAKYGSLVNMIQGLGIKHQPMLPTKGEGDQAPFKPKSDHPVEHWAEQIVNDTVEEPTSGSSKVDAAERAGHFERPLREIRVGESPSHPWGFSVPDVEPAIEGSSQEANMGSKRHHTSAKIHNAPSMASNGEAEVTKKGHKQMIFTGPVFIGYPPEQVAPLMRQFNAK